MRILFVGPFKKKVKPPNLARIAEDRIVMLGNMDRMLGEMQTGLFDMYAKYPAQPQEFDRLQAVWLNVAGMREVLNKLRRDPDGLLRYR